jgi:hypothetical protein
MKHTVIIFLIFVFGMVIAFTFSMPALSLENAKEAHKEMLNAQKQSKIDERRNAWLDVELKIENTASSGESSVLLDYDRKVYPTFEKKIAALGYKVEITPDNFVRVSW